MFNYPNVSGGFGASPTDSGLGGCLPHGGGASSTSPPSLHSVLAAAAGFGASPNSSGSGSGDDLYGGGGASPSGAYHAGHLSAGHHVQSFQSLQTSLKQRKKNR